MITAEPIVSWYKKRNTLSRISQLINLELDESFYVYENSEISLKIVRSLSITSKLQGFILFKSLLRFGDLYNFDLPAIVRDEKFSLIQNKNKKLLVKAFNIIHPMLKTELINFDEFYEILNYQILSNEIKRFVRRYQFLDSVEWKHSCHIFRHLEASYKYSKGIPISFIARDLGDLESTVKNSYIHKELLQIFS